MEPMCTPMESLIGPGEKSMILVFQLQSVCVHQHPSVFLEENNTKER